MNYMPNSKDILDPKLLYTNQQQKEISSNPHNRQIAQPVINMGQDKQMVIDVPWIANLNINPNMNGNVVVAWAEGNENGNNGIQLQAKEFDLIGAAGDIDEKEEVNANCILMANLQQASTSDTQTDKALIYDSDGSAEKFHQTLTRQIAQPVMNMGQDKQMIIDVPWIANPNINPNMNGNVVAVWAEGNENRNNEEQYTELLEPITKPHTGQQNNSNVISVESSIEHIGGIVEQHHATVEETHAYFESIYTNLVTEVEKVNTVNGK
nr:hypothetical protein [Tanacetum cinerariifolium]